ncbi:DUF4492 domain-containing protein [Labilibacter sediminis]|nr:DUF4492 domain-containing protein [Labilibacter sediminis]
MIKFSWEFHAAIENYKRMKRIVEFYVEGFTNLPDWARSVWFIILLKLLIMFVIFKLFFFQNKLKKEFSNDEDRANYVIEQITIP